MITVGDPSYREQLCIMALGSNGSLSLQYLMDLDYEFILEINNTTKAMIKDVQDGK